MVYTVFLSHSSADSKWVRWIKENAQGVGINVYLYEHDAQPGRLIADKVRTAIQQSDALVVLLTASGQSSTYVQQEIGAAKMADKPIIPLVQPGTKPDLAMLEGVEYIPFDFARPKEALKTLLPHLQRLKQAKEDQLAVLLGLGSIILLGFLFTKN